MIFENAALTSVNYAAQAILLLGFGLLLRHYFRVYHRPYLRFWSYAALYYSASAATSFLRVSGASLSSISDASLYAVTTIQLATVYIALALLVFGVFDILRQQPPKQAYRRLIYAVCCGFAAWVTVVGQYYSHSIWAISLRDTLMFLLSGLVLVSIGLIIFNQGPKSMGPRLISLAFCLIGGKNILLVHTSLLSANMTLSGFVWALQGLFNLVFLAIAAVGVIIWLLESERHRTYKALQQAEYLNTHDALTGIENREELMSKLPAMIEHCRAHHRHLSIFIIGLNRFKAVNDTLGIRGGDRVLIEVSRRLQNMRPAPLSVARMSGDVFLVAFDHVKRRSLVEHLGRSLKSQIEAQMHVDGKNLNLSCAIGIARYPQNSVYADSLLSKANIAFSQAKSATAEQMVFYKRGMDESYIRLIDIEPELKVAFERNEFVLHLQPLYAQNVRQLNGFEALIRWQHPQRGLLPPSEFLPFVEELGLSTELDDWVLENTAQILATWRQKGITTLPIAVNICAHHFQNPELISKLKRLFQQYQLDYADIELEITENVAMTDIQAGLNVLEQLRTLGIRVSIDDFGTGYSSLAYLRRLPVDKIKIDRSFIKELLQDSNNSENTIVRTLIELSHGLRKRVVAEGVETSEQLNLLNLMRCDQVQGYLLSPPINLKLAAELLSEHWQQQRIATAAV